MMTMSLAGPVTNPAQGDPRLDCLHSAGTHPGPDGPQAGPTPPHLTPRPREGLPLTMKSCFYPLIGDKIFGWPGDLVTQSSSYSLQFSESLLHRGLAASDDCHGHDN
jgi:hypothetical protein